MVENETVQTRARGVPLRSLRVQVVDGPNQGAEKLAGSEVLSIGTAQSNDLTLGDDTVSRFHVELRRTDDGVSVVDLGSTNGTYVGAVRIERALVPAGTTLTLGNTQIRVLDGERFEAELLPDDRLGGLCGRTPTMRRLMGRIERVAKADTSALLIGESGTGKERIAEAIHQTSPRAPKPFVTVDCGSLSPTLVASELFGHERGAFTGAVDRHVGAFERADGGTIFLDEIGELALALQPTLLGVLERRRFRRLGGKDDVATNVRVVSATNRDLRDEVNAGKFRLDLYYRLGVVVLEVPPLRERTDDIPLLVEHFLKEAGFSGRVEDLISQATMDMFVRHRWPGNVRELRNVVEALLAMGETPELTQGAAPKQAGDPGDPFSPIMERPYGDARASLLRDFEHRYLSKLLARTGGNVSKASREARMDRSHLIDLLRRHRLK